MNLAKTCGLVLEIYWLYHFLHPRTIFARENKFFPNTMYVDKLCNSKLVVSKAVKLQIWHPPKLAHCTVYLSPDSGDSLMARFIFYKYEVYFPECTEESIQLRAGEQTLLGPLGYCEREQPNDEYDLGDNGSLTYVHTYFHHKLTATVLITEVFRRLLFASGCSNSSFYCSEQKFCIDESLVCNADDDCGNGEDEKNWCGYTPLLTVLVIVVLLCGLTILLLLCYFSYTRRKNEELLRYDSVTYSKDVSRRRRSSTPNTPFYMMTVEAESRDLSADSREVAATGSN